VPPNNEAVKRNVSLIVTAVSDSTSFSITDDDMDGDNDDNVSGLLMAGQSYVLYIKDNGINDDALYASGGILTRDGDYYIINSNKLIYASMSTDSDWQHDFVPAVNKKSIGQKFYVYAPKVTSSLRDLNVFAYEPSTTISIYKISTIPTTQTGYTNISLANKQLVVQKTINPGQDIIHYFSEGRDVMESGGTYLIESNKDVSVQYGALWGNARDGGGYVPSNNGNGSGELFYFAVPYQVNGEQEIRIASWDDANAVELSRYSNGSWISMKTWSLDKLKPADWVGKQNGNATFPTVFRVTCTPGKRVSVMEANWMETGSTNTSDMSTMLSSETGTSSGKKFLAYMLPPSRENNVINPFTRQFFTESITHFHLLAGSKNTTVTIKDAKTNGQVLNKSYQIGAGRYADAFFTMNEWKSIYNGTGTPSGLDRPYVLIEATEHIAVLSTNFNDNWMSYFGSSLPQSFTQIGSLTKTVANPGEEVVLISQVETDQLVSQVKVAVKIASGLIPLECKLKNNGTTIEIGEITSSTQESTIKFRPLSTISATDNYTIETKVIVASTYNDGATIPNEAVLSIETIVSGTVAGDFQQSYLTRGIQNNSANTSNLLYSACQVASISATSNNSWNTSWVDYNNDGHDDLFVATKDANQENELYRNNGNGTFTKITNNPLVKEKANTVAAVWADIDNNGSKDVLLVNAAQHRSKLFINNGGGSFTELANSGIDPHPQYFHGAAFADFDNDGFLDLIMTNFFQTRFHQLYRNNGNNTFTSVYNTPVTTESERAMAPILADYNNDGLVDIFIPNGNNRPNSLFKNIGNFQFEKVNDSAMNADAKNSVGAAWGDFNNDGFLDLLVANASGQNNDLYRNKGDGTFLKITNSIISIQGGDSHGVAWLDINNDGWLDVYITNDGAPSFLYLNDGQGGFTRKLDEVISGNIGNSFGVAVGDYNKDGQLDLAVATHTDGNTKFYCHNSSSSHWIGFQLQGLHSNKQALGARVAIKSNGIWQYRQNLPVTGFGSQGMQNLHFGIANTSSVDSALVIWPSGVKQYLNNISSDTYNVVLEEAGKKVIGMVFHDMNNNGVREEGEPVVPNIRLKINEGKLNLASDEDGQFMFRINENSFQVGINQPHWTITPSRTQYQFLQGAELLNVMLPVTAVQLGHDLSISLATTAWRRGFTNETTIQVSNLGTQKVENAKAEVKFPTGAYLISSDQSYSNTAAKTYRWDVGTLNPGSVKTIHVVDSIGLGASIGQKLLIEASTFAAGTDINQANNSLNEEVEIVGAIDPNDISVSPRGDGPQGYININQWLTYTIRFENVGTYKATYVFLKNQLPAGLDISTFEIIASSHDYTYTLSERGLLDVAYRHISLPAAIDDSVGAHGYLKYRIKPLHSIAGGHELANSAKIYFDFEEPVITNTTLNTIKYQGRHEVRNLKIFPNPANDFVVMVIDEHFFRVTNPHVIAQWIISDCSGRPLMEGNGDYESIMKINVSNIPKGIYILRAFDQSGQVYVGKLIKD
jgi:uncharacterized repeat protein (TIGR01451 family)